MDIYSNPQLYDSIHKNYKWDLALIKKFAKQNIETVLELASGTGRLAYPILDLGLDYTGLELSRKFLETANKKLGEKENLLKVICESLIWDQLLILFLLVLILFAQSYYKRCKKLFKMCSKSFKPQREVFIVYFYS